MNRGRRLVSELFLLMKRRLVNDRCDGPRWLFCERLLIYTLDDLISPGTQRLRLHGSRVPG